MKWKKIIVDYLTLTRKDRIAIITILSLLLVIFFLPKTISHGSNKSVVTDTSWIAALKGLEIKNSEINPSIEKNTEDNSFAFQYDRSRNYYTNRKATLFYFDPNNINTEEWQKLGLRDKTILTIQNYLNKGGRFNKADDLKKIYGLFPDEFERLAPYIKIENSNNRNDLYSNNKEYSPDKFSTKKSTARNKEIDINTSDTVAFIALPGIGSKLAFRIVNFREKLGGFYSINQVGETFGLPDSTFQKIKPMLKLDITNVRKININTATVEELKAHPYIRYSLANPIIAYRNQHGPFQKIMDLKKILLITDELYDKISPYLTIE